jgi:hypothetical protein
MYLTTSTAILATTIRLVSAGVLIPRDVSTDNSCGTTGSGGSPSAFTCPTDLPCCSVNGWCGSTDAYCLASNRWYVFLSFTYLHYQKLICLSVNPDLERAIPQLLLQTEAALDQVENADLEKEVV